MKIFSCKFINKLVLDIERMVINIKFLHNIRPLLKLTDRLLLVGVMTDEDVQKLLVMIDPETWDGGFEKGKFGKNYLFHSESNNISLIV